MTRQDCEQRSAEDDTRNGQRRLVQRTLVLMLARRFFVASPAADWSIATMSD